MNFIADLHIHSHYSIATSKNLTPEYIDYWAMIKGINVIGTGDAIHLGWSKELKNKLLKSSNGLYRLKDEYKLDEAISMGHKGLAKDVYFMLTGEVSSIYKKNGKVRKVHNICVFPDFDALDKVQNKLDAIGNIRSDGRPILGLDSKDLLDMVLKSSDSSFLIPAHIWTPWFSVLGSRSGFDSIEECFEDLSPYIFALETGLSSDPPMNRLCSILDKYRFISNSDAHSLNRLGREANIFDTDMSYKGIYNALKHGDGFISTIEFFPQEGKYHYDGHRKCNICWSPFKTIENNGICPVCNKQVTMGVMNRVIELSDRKEPIKLESFYSITQLSSLLAEIMNIKSDLAKTVQREYFRLISEMGSEFYILLFANLSEIKHYGGEALSEGIRRLRNAEVIIKNGFDGEFGQVRVFQNKGD